MPTPPVAHPAAGLTRRAFVAAGARLAGGALLAAPLGCLSPSAPGVGSAGSARLQARPPAVPPPTVLEAGWHPIELDGRTALLYVPVRHGATSPAPLLLSLHGARGEPARWLAGFPEIADATGTLMLAPQSLLPTWDLIHGPFGADVAFIDRALAWTFERCAVDPARLAAHGFSDGATYALGLGLTNGDLFTHVVAHSPGFLKTGERRGRPHVFVSHGTDDRVLPIDACSRRIVPQLRGDGYDVAYQEFAGGHELPRVIATAASEWVRG